MSIAAAQWIKRPGHLFDPECECALSLGQFQLIADAGALVIVTNADGVRVKCSLASLEARQREGETDQLVPIKRFLDPEEIAYAALYLASDQARGITGTALVVDGGALAGYVD